MFETLLNSMPNNLIYLSVCPSVFPSICPSNHPAVERLNDSSFPDVAICAEQTATTVIRPFILCISYKSRHLQNFIKEMQLLTAANLCENNSTNVDGYQQVKSTIEAKGHTPQHKAYTITLPYIHTNIQTL